MCDVQKKSCTGNVRLTQCTWNSESIGNTGQVDLLSPAPICLVDGKDIPEVLSCSEANALVPVTEDIVAARNSRMSTHIVENNEDLRRIYAVTICLTDCLKHAAVDVHSRKGELRRAGPIDVVLGLRHTHSRLGECAGKSADTARMLISDGPAEE
jgi:hypothetical protein